LPDQISDLGSTGGPSGAPRPFIGRIVRLFIVFVVGIVVIAGVAVAFAKLPSSTSGGSIAVRGVVGGLLGLFLIVVVRRMSRSLAEPPPPPPQTVDARTAEVVYVCPVCGTRVRLELAATAKAPKHCGEEMEAQVSPY
jgi:hypothetical protein